MLGDVLMSRLFRLGMMGLVSVSMLSCADSREPEVSEADSRAPDLATELESILGQPPSKSSTSFVVIEMMDAARYTYVKLKNGEEERWVAAPKVILAVGDEVSVGKSAVMENFTSPSLKRTFAQIYFANEIRKVGDKPGVVPEKKVPDVPTAVVSPAAGGWTIEKLMASPATFAVEPARVRGQVVKFNAQIMGRNWIHIRDGSGSVDAGTHDLTITTQATARVGQTVEAVGKLIVNKDFGAGYSYPVLMEDAAIEVLK